MTAPRHRHDTALNAVQLASDALEDRQGRCERSVPLSELFRTELFAQNPLVSLLDPQTVLQHGLARLHRLERVSTVDVVTENDQ